ncbi:MAG TPA: hypothetical protein VK492_20320 [Chitinophagaceae bacterium]|nr:hypothetical protein [Chitinophagaceae bacterium]
MEVHHHAHTPRKKWTHYFWEFLMLFLAVFCGFLAENQREHIVEKKRAKEYARSLVHDLSTDTSQLSNFMKRVPFFIAKYDSFLLLHKNLKIASTGQLYYYSSFVNTMTDFTSNVSTLDQIKNSGSLRYFDPYLQDKISEYARLVDRNKDYKPFAFPIYERAVTLGSKIFDGEVFYYEYLFDPEKQSSRPADSFMHSNPPLISSDPTLMKEFSNAVIAKRKAELIMLNVYYKPAFDKAVELINLLSEKYHFK